MPSKTPTSNLKNGFLSRETDSPDWKRLRIENHFEEEFFLSGSVDLITFLCVKSVYVSLMLFLFS